MKKRKKLILILFLLVFIACAGTLAAYLFAPEPPSDEIEYARLALSEARNANAEAYAPRTFRQASAYYDSAMVHWKRENERFILARNYDEVIGFARQSADNSAKAVSQTRQSASSLKSKLRDEIRELNSIVGSLANIYTRYPLPNDVRNRISRGKMLLSEAVVHYDKGSYLQANRKVRDADPLLRNSWDLANENLREYFRSYNQWMKWWNNTIAESRQKRIAVILVDKFAGKCYLYQNGTKKAEFDAELGMQWIGDKRQRGDKATPEGLYHITKKLEGSSTKYYKALLINYPNDEDKERFRQEVARGTLPASARIGGLIEIHGHGGKGTDWTDGCVALTDRDMDRLYRDVKVGTPVTIVGSSLPLDEVIRKRNGGS